MDYCRINGGLVKLNYGADESKVAKEISQIIKTRSDAPSFASDIHDIEIWLSEVWNDSGNNNAEDLAKRFLRAYAFDGKKYQLK